MLRGFSIGSVLLLLQNCELPSLSSIFAAPSLRIFIFVKLVRARRLFCHHSDLSASQKATGLDDVPSLFQVLSL